MPKVNFSTMRSVFFFGLIFVFAIALLYIFRPFFYPIFWAAILAIMFYPLYKYFLKILKSPNLTSSISLVIVILTIFIPLTALSLLIVNESFKLYNLVSEKELFSANTVEGVSTWLENTPLQPYVENIKSDWVAYSTSATKKISEVLFSSIKNITQNSVRFVFMLFIMFYTLFFFFRDGEKILKFIMHLSPLGDKYEKMLYDKFTSTTWATLKSTLIIGSIQGFLGGILFWAVGIKGAFIWGIVMAAFSILPAIGPFVVWLPAAIIMLALGNIWQGITIILVGSLVIGSIDNLLRPPLVGKDTQLHSLIVLFSTLGGIFLFGISGFIIGPIIAALFMAILSIYNHYYENELRDND